MADVTRRVDITAHVKGAQESADALRGIAKAQDEVAVASDKTERATASMERRLEQLQRKLDPTYRGSQALAKATRDLDAALGQGLVSQTRHAELLALATTRYQTATAAVSPLTAAMAQAENQAAGLAGRVGVVGSVLTALGPVGVASAAAIGATVLALSAGSEAAHKFAADMGRIRDASNTLGVTTTQFQAIADKGAEFALSEDKIRTGLERLSGAMDEFRQRSGKAFEIVDRADSGLAYQLATAHDLAAEIDLLGRAYDRMGESQRNALSRAVFGKGGIDLGQLIQGIREGGGLGALTREFERSGDAIDGALIKRIARLKREIDDTASDAQRNFASIFSETFLTAQFKAVEGFRELSRFAKDFTLSRDLLRLLTMGPLDLVGLNPLRSGASLPDTQPRPRNERVTLRGRVSDTSPQLGTDYLSEFGQLPDMSGTSAEFEKRQQGMAQAADRVVQALLPEIEQMKNLRFAIQDLEAAQSEGVRSQMDHAASADQALETYRNQLAALEALKAAYPGLSAAQAATMAGLADSLGVAQAVTGAQRLQAQEAATFNALRRQGVSEEQALRQAAAQTAIEQARINAQAQAQIITLEDQLTVAKAQTGAEKLKAQETARFNQLVRQGVDEELAAVQAATERKIKQEEINNAIAEQARELAGDPGLIERVCATDKDERNVSNNGGRRSAQIIPFPRKKKEERLECRDYAAAV